MNAHQHFIGGTWIGSEASLPVLNPSHGQEMARIARGGAAEIDAAVKAGQAAMDGEWGRLDAASRGRLMLKLAELIRRDAEILAKMESEDVGKPMTLARNDAQVCARYFEYYGGAADKVGLGNTGDLGLSPYQVLVSASMVEKESGHAEDAPSIAAVIVNRLRKGMLLQIDATLCFAKGGCPPVPVEADKKIDSPYNTYKVAGLPPTPIETVSSSAITAAVNPAPVPYKFYVSDKHGKSYFATTQAEHERNIVKARNAD